MTLTRPLSFSIAIVAFLTLGGVGHAQTALTCEQPATTLVGGVGSTFDVICPSGCGSAIVWGAGPYTDDSSICTAAMHAGTIGPGGGSFTVTIGGGDTSFPGSISNGITTSDWGEWGRSFYTTGAGGYPALDCYANAQSLESGRYMCPAGCSDGGTVWGTDPYTDDSSICRAAIHAGASSDSGRTITLEIMPGLEAYEGSTVSGVTTSPYGSWGRSFTFQ